MGLVRTPPGKEAEVVNSETKLALIIGFVFILVVGVLISDHLSAVHRAELADVTQGEDLALASPPPDPLAPRFGEPSTAAARPAGNPSSDPVDAGQPWNDGTSRAVSPPPLVIRQGTASSPGVEGHDADRSWGAPASGDHPLASSVRADPDPLAAPEPEPQPRRYVVQANDSLYSIARDLYGRGTLWRRIRDANRDLVGSDGELIRPGQTLIIPPAGTSRATRSPGDAQSLEPARGSTFAVAQTYTVKPGDSLERIAISLLGSASRVDDIVELNRELIDDPDTIRVGMELRIPGR